MPLFQNSVVKKQLQSQDTALINAQWNVYKTHFHNLHIQNNIRNSKEEQYQGEFLIDLFVNVLGYIKNPNPNFTLTTEYKNVKDSKKADGAILVNDKVRAVIELKGTNTTDLGKIEAQAFGYKNNQPDCTYVITSNFEKLRFYIDNAIEYLEFNLFQLNKAEFELLYLCLAYENIKNNVAKSIKDQSVSAEDVITKKLYKDYSLFKRELFHNLVQLNPQYDPLELFQKSQKLLDRFLFIFFAEDRNLLPTNLIFRINKEWQQLQEMRIKVSLYDRYKTYFSDLNTGAKVQLPAFSQTNSTQKEEHQIFAYNGGLFKEDVLLNSLVIDDNVLFLHTEKLSNYDFASEVDVNILGHIFENSLNELDEVKAQLEGQDIDKTTTKRKKDGVFYTPKYITKYIVENTVGKLCTEKKAELGIVEEDYTADKKRQKKTLQTLVEKLGDYRKWLLQLTICDPACGSGAFLNQALDFLIAEHQYLDELQAKLFGDALVLSDIATSILENNLFGVDLNEESVEIAKLSLWLRTAKPNRKLNDLNSNIKCGNSLIDDPAIAGDKAFNWQKAFPRVFEEQHKKAFHITTAIHDSRTSQRMIDYKVRERRNNGANPYPNVCYLKPEDEAVITQTVAEIVAEQKLNVLQYNICKDHMHLVLVCEEEDVPVIMQKIKGRTARVHNSVKGINPLVQKENEKAVPLWTQKYGCKEITSPEQLHNTLAYVQHNRSKHQLPAHPKATALLIKNMLCSQEKAFAPEYKGGFDVIIGNPPYVFARDNFSQNEKYFFAKNYISAKYQVNTYLLFIEKTVCLLKQNRVYGLIIPNAWLMVYSGEGLRKFLLNECKLNQVINLEGYSFESANVETVILLAEKQQIAENKVEIFLNNGEEFYLSHTKEQQDFQAEKGFEFRVFLDVSSDVITRKIIDNSDVLDDLVDIKAGLQAYEKDKGEPKQTAEDVINRPFDYDYPFDKETYKYLEGKDVNRYFISWSGLYLKYGKHLAAPRTFNLFKGEKVIVREITGSYPRCLISTYSDELYLYNRSNIAIVSKANPTVSLKYVTVVLNSKLMSYYFLKNTAKSVRKLFPKIILNDLRKFPIKNIPVQNQLPFIENADLMLSLNKDLQATSQKFQRSLQRKFELSELPKKLQDWYLLTYADFIKELAKKKVKLSLAQEAEWEDYFTQESQKAQALKNQIDQTDKEIDQMVYTLYGLTEEEIKIVEEG